MGEGEEAVRPIDDECDTVGADDLSDDSFLAVGWFLAGGLGLDPYKPAVDADQIVEGRSAIPARHGHMAVDCFVLAEQPVDGGFDLTFWGHLLTVMRAHIHWAPSLA